jgi:imidazoleglycerol-phosphate dehydratase
VRQAVIDRRTTETQITGKLRLDGRGRYEISTGIRFLDHMLELLARHGAFDLQLAVRGDLDVDQHHSVEDTGIALGEAVAAALGSRRGIKTSRWRSPPSISPAASMRLSTCDCGSAGSATCRRS